MYEQESTKKKHIQKAHTHTTEKKCVTATYLFTCRFSLFEDQSNHNPAFFLASGLPALPKSVQQHAFETTHQETQHQHSRWINKHVTSTDNTPPRAPNERTLSDFHATSFDALPVSFYVKSNQIKPTNRLILESRSLSNK